MQSETTRTGARLTTNLKHPAFDRPINALEIQRPMPQDDYTATAQTVAYMAELARRDSYAPIVRQAAAAAIAAAAARTPGAIAAAIHRWIRRNVKFVSDASLAADFARDPNDAEVLIPPADLLTMRSPRGDCDDFSMLAAAMLRAAGIRYAYSTVAAEQGNPDYSHVYVLADGVPLDASHGPTLGWAARPAGKRDTWATPDEEERKTMRQGRTLKGLGFDWQVFGDIAQAGMKTAGQVLIPRYSVPQLNPGQYIQGPNGVMYQQPAGGSAAIGLPIAGVGGDSMLWLLGGLAAVVTLVVVAKR